MQKCILQSSTPKKLKTVLRELSAVANIKLERNGREEQIENSNVDFLIRNLQRNMALYEEAHAHLTEQPGVTVPSYECSHDFMKVCL